MSSIQAFKAHKQEVNTGKQGAQSKGPSRHMHPTSVAALHI